jgi:hypothetical protein
MPRAATLPYPGNQIIDADRARNLHADASEHMPPSLVAHQMLTCMVKRLHDLVVYRDANNLNSGSTWAALPKFSGCRISFWVASGVRRGRPAVEL